MLASKKQYGGTWQTTADTLSIEGQQCQGPCLVVNAAGDAVAVWNFQLYNLSEVQVSSKTYGKTWEEAQRISLEGHTSILQQVIIDSTYALCCRLLFGILQEGTSIDSKRIAEERYL